MNTPSKGHLLAEVFWMEDDDGEKGCAVAASDTVDLGIATVAMCNAIMAIPAMAWAHRAARTLALTLSAVQPGETYVLNDKFKTVERKS